MISRRAIERIRTAFLFGSVIGLVVTSGALWGGLAGAFTFFACLFVAVEVAIHGD